MKRSTLFLAGALGLLAPTAARAQASAGPPGQAPQAQPAPTGTPLAMAEDIEIMRRLLNRDLLGRGMASCTSCHSLRGFTPDGKVTALDGATLKLAQRCPAVQAQTAFSPDGKWLATSDGSTVRLWDAATGKLLSTRLAGHVSGGAEGVYLKGQGVIYTVTLPPSPHERKAAPAKPAAKSPSDWERLRTQLRGGKEEPAPAPDTKDPTVAEVILKALAKHGHNFTQLTPKETVTVAVVFRELADTPLGTAPSGQPRTGLFGSTTTTGGQSGTSTTTGRPTTARDYELLGDLHLKQARPQEALRAYSKAFELVGGTDQQDNAAKRNLYRKVAQAYLGLADRSNPAEHEKVIAQALKYLQRAAEPAAGKADAGAPARLPARLIVSAPKSLLDQVGSGKIGFEEFRRAASVEYLPPALDKRPTDEVPQSGTPR